MMAGHGEAEPLWAEHRWGWTERPRPGRSGAGRSIAGVAGWVEGLGWGHHGKVQYRCLRQGVA